MRHHSIRHLTDTVSYHVVSQYQTMWYHCRYQTMRHHSIIPCGITISNHVVAPYHTIWYHCIIAYGITISHHRVSQYQAMWYHSIRSCGGHHAGRRQLNTVHFSQLCFSVAMAILSGDVRLLVDENHQTLMSAARRRASSSCSEERSQLDLAAAGPEGALSIG